MDVMCDRVAGLDILQLSSSDTPNSTQFNLQVSMSTGTPDSDRVIDAELLRSFRFLRVLSESELTEG